MGLTPGVWLPKASSGIDARGLEPIGSRGGGEGMGTASGGKVGGGVSGSSSVRICQVKLHFHGTGGHVDWRSIQDRGWPSRGPTPPRCPRAKFESETHCVVRLCIDKLAMFVLRVRTRMAPE